MNGVIVVDGYTAETFGLGVVEDNYDADSEPGKYTRARLAREGSFASSNCQPIREGLRTYNKVYKVVNGKHVFDRVEVMEAYHNLTKSGRKSKKISWRVTKIIPAAEFNPAEMEKTLPVFM